MTAKRINLADWVERKKEAGTVEVEMQDGTVYSIDPPETWGDDQLAAARLGNLHLAQALLGDRYEEFVEKGGSSARLIHLLTEEHGLSLGE